MMHPSHKINLSIYARAAVAVGPPVTTSLSAAPGWSAAGRRLKGMTVSMRRLNTLRVNEKID